MQKRVQRGITRGKEIDGIRREEHHGRHRNQRKQIQEREKCNGSHYDCQCDGVEVPSEPGRHPGDYSYYAEPDDRNERTAGKQ